MRIYFLGIAGTAMGNAALLLRDLGHEVLGSDEAVYAPMDRLLANAGITVLEGFDVDRLRALKPDLVVVGNAFSRGNSEIEHLLEFREIEFVSLPETLARFVLAQTRNIVVAGTHGKTTTTALAAYLLEQAGVEAGHLIGGAPVHPASGWRAAPPGAPFVIEGDEYDSAFFDKRSKFIHYRPHIVVVNNLEFDHADIFRDLPDVQRSFAHLLRIVPKNGYVLINGDDANAVSLLPVPWTRTIRVGVSETNDLRIENFASTSGGSAFDLVWGGQAWKRVEWGLAGLFNARNAAMAMLACALATDESDVSAFEGKGIGRFHGVRRRQQVLFESSNLVVLEDFAHHPTAIREVLLSVRERFPAHRLIAAFEPRSNTSRLESMREVLTKALAIADAVIVGEAKRRPDESAKVMDTATLARDLSTPLRHAIACPSNEAALLSLLAAIETGSASPQIVVFLTNGSFGGIIGRLADQLRAKAAEVGS